MPRLSRLALLLGSLALPASTLATALAPLGFATAATAKDASRDKTKDGAKGGKETPGSGTTSGSQTDSPSADGTDTGSDGSLGGAIGGTVGGAIGGAVGDIGGAVGNGNGNGGNGNGHGGNGNGQGGDTGTGSGGSTTAPPPRPEPTPEPTTEPKPEPEPVTSPSDDGNGLLSAPAQTTPVIARDLNQLAPYAEALLALNRARAAHGAAAADLSRLQSMGPHSRARAFPSDGPGIDRAAWQADLDRLAPFAQDHARLTSLTDAEKALLFPAETGHDAAAYQAALDRYARNAADYAALKSLPKDRLQSLYPGARTTSGYRSALARAESHLAAAETALAQAMATADRLSALLIGPRPLTAAEAGYLSAYMNG